MHHVSYCYKCCCLQLRMYRVVWFYRWCEYSSNIRLLWLTLFRNMSVSLASVPSLLISLCPSIGSAEGSLGPP